MERVQAMRSRFADDARPLMSRGFIAPQKLAEVRNTVGYETALNDVAIYCNVFRRHWSELDAHTCLTEVELTEAFELVARGFTVLGEREQAPERLDDSALTRQRALTDPL